MVKKAYPVAVIALVAVAFLCSPPALAANSGMADTPWLMRPLERLSAGALDLLARVGIAPPRRAVPAATRANSTSTPEPEPDSTADDGGEPPPRMPFEIDPSG